MHNLDKKCPTGETDTPHHASGTGYHRLSVKFRTCGARDPDYDLDGSLYSSSDGQKFETRLSTINARHSPKYFGLKKGVVAYTLVANHVPVNAQIIGANEHESHYVFDILFNNTTDIQPDIHSTDTHGTNEVNFALLHVFGYQFAPRYQDLQTKVREALYGFKHPSQYGAMLLKPIRKIKTRLIVEEWEQMQRILVSLALKTTTQSMIVGKLSAYARRNKTRRALWEYDNIIRSLYLLDYIDSPPLRRNVQRALNRGENYHQLRRAVSYANFGKLRFKTEYEQQLWEECSRLITTRLWPFRSRQEGRMCLTIDELSPKVMLSKEDLYAAPARSDHTGVGSVCATVFAAGLAPRPTLASRGDAGSGSPYGHGRLTGHGAGDRARFHELPSGLEPGHVVSAPGQSDSARVTHDVAGACRGDDRPWGGRYRGTPQWPQDHGQRLLSRCGAFDQEAGHPLFRPEMGVDDAPGPGALGAAGMGDALSHRPMPAC